MPRSATPDGRIVASSDAARQGQVREARADFELALAGSPSVDVVDSRPPRRPMLPVSRDTVIREYLPLRQDDRTVLVVGLWRDALPMLTRSTTSGATS